MAESLTQALPTPQPRKADQKPAGQKSPGPAKMKVVPANDPPKPATPPAPGPEKKADRPNTPEPVSAANPKFGRVLAILSFLLLVVLPGGFVSNYLYSHAADQFVSRTAFSVRQLNSAPAPGLSNLSGLAGFVGLSGSSADDGNILFDFLRSHEIAAQIDGELDLRGIWSTQINRDPYFSFDHNDALEDLHRYWGKMVRVNFDGSAGIISVEVRAFSAQDARLIAEAIVQKSGDKINALSQIAQGDAMQFAQTDLKESEARVEAARRKMADFRNRTQMIDPRTTLQIQSGLLGTLESQLADALIRSDLLQNITRESDPRVDRIHREIEVIEARITAEKAKLGFGSDLSTGTPLATLIGQYEALEIDLRLATEGYAQSLAAFEIARTDARRQSRYLATHISPTFPESPEHPHRLRLALLVSGFLILGWVLMALTVSSLRDRK